MKLFERIFTALLLLTIPLVCSCATSDHHLKPANLIGSWSTLENYDATEVVFSIGKNGEYLFNSFFRGRPYEDGTWQIKGKDLVVLANGNNTYTFKNVRIENETLSFTENQKISRFKRSLEGKPPAEDIRGLLSSICQKSGYSFTEPKNVEFSWQTGSDNEALIVGLQSVTLVRVNGDYSKVNQIGALFEQAGFTRNDLNTSELVTGYRKDRLVGQLIIATDPASDQECSVTLRLGHLP
ncbi:MAG: hypothetical protein KKC80_07825 [Candidatus Margulisbacteria bacterium]|nr:hypothetical protein [Candidatus Margulisiibacteriota bacterium]MBU1617255.1 hypothetical protein [Candidatus Margulisiibacteriota bacterium]MBU1867771.1 hypothetical protein [Candidatus Margulisiibacteriota bacterium]